MPQGVRLRRAISLCLLDHTPALFLLNLPSLLTKLCSLLMSPWWERGVSYPVPTKLQPPATTPGFQVSPWAWRSCLAWEWKPLSSGPMSSEARHLGLTRKAGLQPRSTLAATCFPHAAHRGLLTQDTPRAILLDTSALTFVS